MVEDVDEEVQAFLDPFFRETGYSRWDILAFNYFTRLVVTRNGGVYQLEDDQVKWLKGPPVHADDRI